MFFSDDMRELVALFQKHGVRFAVCGCFAVAHYGFIRATMDFDMLVVPNEENARKIMAALEEFGFGQCGIHEEAFLAEGTAVTLGAQPNQVDLLTSMGTRRTTEETVSDAEDVLIEDVPMRVVSLADLLDAKVRSGRAKDRIDLEELLALHPEMKSEN